MHFAVGGTSSQRTAAVSLGLRCLAAPSVHTLFSRYSKHRGSAFRRYTFRVIVIHKALEGENAAVFSLKAADKGAWSLNGCVADKNEHSRCIIVDNLTAAKIILLNIVIKIGLAK